MSSVSIPSSLSISAAKLEACGSYPQTLQYSIDTCIFSVSYLRFISDFFVVVSVPNLPFVITFHKP